MTIKTRSQFYFVDNITENNLRVPFDEGLGEVNAQVDLGNFAPSELPERIAFALTDAGTQEYTVTFNRTDRTYTISAPSAFDLLFSTGAAAATSIAPVLGFDSTDLTGQTSYTSQNPAGSVYRPQVKLQDYVDSINQEEAVSASINESASGVIETISFGRRNFFEFNIRYVTDKEVGKSGIIEQNANAVSELRSFLQFATTKSNLEFMPDRDDPGTFNVVLLEATRFNRDGVGFEIRELISEGLNDFFETGILRFRVID